MALKWVIHIACHVLGYPNEESGAGYPIKTNQLKPVSEMKSKSGDFQMPLHYPRYKKADYEEMDEWRLDLLLSQYGLTFKGTLQDKREFAMGAFLWPNQF